MRPAIFAASLTLAGCKHPSVADEVQANQEDLSTAPATAAAPLALAAPTATGQISFVALLARNGVAGVHMALAPMVRQSRSYSSGAASALAVLGFWGDLYREGQLVQLLPAKPSGDVAFGAMIAFFKGMNDPATRTQALNSVVTDEVAGGEGVVHTWRPSLTNPGAYTVDVFAGQDKALARVQDTGEVGVPKDGLSMSDLQHQIDAGRPIIVPIQAWGAAPTPATGVPVKTSYDGNGNGHYAVVVGYDKNNIYLMDPATTGNYTYIPRAEFVSRWHDQQGTTLLRRSAIVVHRDHPAFDFDNVLKMN